MKRWLVTTNDNDKFMLYYRTQQDALKFPGAVSAEEIINDSTEINIQTIKNNGNMILTVCIDEQTIEKSVYRLESPLGYVDAQIMCDTVDGLYYDLIQYKEHNIGQFSEPLAWAAVTSDEFVSLFINRNPIRIKIHSRRRYGEPKLTKPEELRGKSQDFSATFCGKCKCACFVVGNDIWIKHRDFFSPAFRPPPEDMDKPLSYIAKKYFDYDKSDKFVYPDGWGDIILRSEAWIVIENIIPLLERNNIIHVKASLEKAFLEAVKCGWPNAEWEMFFEEVLRKAMIVEGDE